jgi:oligoribonuclease
LVWIDLEMTGLNPETSVILEIAAVVTDGSLQTVAEGPDIAIHYPERPFRA